MPAGDEAAAAPLPLPAPQLLPDHRVLVTGVHISERARLEELVEAAGGGVVGGVSSRDPPHLVLTRSARSPKYRACLRLYPHTPALLPTWLIDSLAAGRRLPYDAYRVGPFVGLTVCLSGLSPSRKASLAAQVVAGGGIHSAALDKKCTQLVTTSTQSDKYKFARREGIPVVKPRWVEQSVARGWCQEESDHTVEEEGGGQNSVAAAQPTLHTMRPALRPAPSAGGMPSSLAEAGVSLLSLPLPGGDGAASAQIRGGGSNGGCCVEPTAGMPSDSQPQRRTEAAAEQRGGRGARGGGIAAPPLGPAEVRRGERWWERYDSLAWDDATPTFLDGCRLLLVGCSADEAAEGLHLTRMGAAKRYVEWRADLSHVVVGSDLNAAEAAAALDHLTSHRSCRCVAFEWLRRGVEQRRMLPAAGYEIPLASLGAAKRRAPGAAGGLTQPAGGLTHDGTTGAAAAGDGFGGAGGASRLEWPQSQGTHSGVTAGEDGAAAAEAGGAGGLQRTQSNAALVQGPLSGCYFTLAAIRGSEDEGMARRAIQEHGGRIFHAGMLSVAAVDRARAFAICPHSLPPHAATLLRNQHPDFRLVPEAQRFTLYWLECSLMYGAPLPPLDRAPLYQPLPYTLPMPGMQAVIVCTSGYETDIKAAIQRTVAIVGGEVTENMTRRNTHLVVPEAKGKKYEHAAAFGVIPITADWVVATVTYGRVQPEGPYHPLMPEGAQQQGGGPGADLHTRTGSGSGAGGAGAYSAGGAVAPSQIGATQMPGAGGLPRQQQQRQLGLPPPPPPQQGRQYASLYQAAVVGEQRLQQRSPQQQQQQPQQQRSPQQQHRGSQPSQVAAPPAPAAGRGSPAGGSQSQRRGGGLRERMSQLKATARPLHPGAAAAGPLGSGAPAQRARNDENAPSGGGQQAAAGGLPGAAAAAASAAPPSLLDTALGALPQCLPTSFGAAGAPAAAAAAGAGGAPQRGQPQQQRSLLDDALEGLHAPAAPAAVPEARSQGAGSSAAAAPTAPESMFEALFGRSSGGSAGPCDSGRAQAAPGTAALAPAPQQLQVAAASGGEAAGESGGGQRRLSGRGGSARRGARPGGGQQLLEAAQSPDAPPAAPPKPSETQEDLDSMLDKIGALLGRVEGPAALGSQQDMPPPPRRAPKRASPQEESCLSNGSGGSAQGRAAKRAAGGGGEAAASSGRALRRSGRARAAEPDLPLMEASQQQVGYEDAPAVELAPRLTRSSASDVAAKARLHQMAAAAGQRRGAGGPAQQQETLVDLLK